MPVLTRPSIVFPPFHVDNDEMLHVLEMLHPEHPQWDTIQKMVRNMEIDRRYLIRPLRETIRHAGLANRAKTYQDESRRLGALAAKEALEFAQLSAAEIDLIIAVSCTGFMMPSLTAYLINDLAFPSTTKQLPICQLGCVAGASAINRAFEYCKAFSKANVLIVCVELSSLCFQPCDETMESLLASSLFGDMAAACVMRNADAQVKGYEVVGNASLLLQKTASYIAYDIKETGFHFLLDKRVMHAIEDVAPRLETFAHEHLNKRVSELGFHVFHTGGKRIIDELVRHLRLRDEDVKHSRQSLREMGNVSSVSVIDVLKRFFDTGVDDGSDGVLAAFGPGFTAEMSAGYWRN